MVDHECAEPYQLCQATRKARIIDVIANNPDATKAELAVLAVVDERTIQRYKNPKETRVSPVDPTVSEPEVDRVAIVMRAIRQLTEAEREDLAVRMTREGLH